MAKLTKEQITKLLNKGYITKTGLDIDILSDMPVDELFRAYVTVTGIKDEYTNSNTEEPETEEPETEEPETEEPETEEPETEEPETEEPENISLDNTDSPNKKSKKYSKKK